MDAAGGAVIVAVFALIVSAVAVRVSWLALTEMQHQRYAHSQPVVIGDAGEVTGDFDMFTFSVHLENVGHGPALGAVTGFEMEGVGLELAPYPLVSLTVLAAGATQRVQHRSTVPQRAEWEGHRREVIGTFSTTYNDVFGRSFQVIQEIHIRVPAPREIDFNFVGQPRLTIGLPPGVNWWRRLLGR